MANYPDWVMKFKKKGTYVNHSNGKYYLYAAHSERVKGTKKVKRICDGYLGRITEKDGLIPPKDKVSGDVEVFEYGLCSTIFHLSKDIYSGFKKIFGKNADFVMVASILSAIYGFYDLTLFTNSYLSVLFPNVDIDKNPTVKQSTAISRGTLMIQDKLSICFEDQKDIVMKNLSYIYKVKINNRFYFSKESEFIKELKQKYDISWEF